MTNATSKILERVGDCNDKALGNNIMIVTHNSASLDLYKVLTYLEFYSSGTPIALLPLDYGTPVTYLFLFTVSGIWWILWLYDSAVYVGSRRKYSQTRAQ